MTSRLAVTLVAAAFALAVLATPAFAVAGSTTDAAAMARTRSASTGSSSPPRARLLVALATSGSLDGDVCGTFAGGDGSSDCPGSDVACVSCPAPGCDDGLANDSRLYAIKLALGELLLSTAVEVALFRAQQQARAFACPTSMTGGSGGWLGGAGPDCPGLAGGELLVGFATGNYAALAAYIDGSTNHTGGPPPAGLDLELRGTGERPLAGLLTSLQSYVEGLEPGGLTCRPYRAVLIADGPESCGGDAPTAAGALAASGVPVSVIGFAVAPASVSALNAIAAAGGTGDAMFVDDAATLAASLSLLARGDALVETCNGSDDDCDGLVDEDFPHLGGACDNRQLGACFQPGTLVCAGDGRSTACSAPAVSPGAEACNGSDDDCDGETDEDDACVGLPELCNGVDDDDDGLVDEDFALGAACETRLGECRRRGTLVCRPDHTGVLCQAPLALPAVPEDIRCDGRDEDCDGLLDEEAYGEMAQVGGVFVDRFEASRPGATADDEGWLQHRRCSRSGVLPWRGSDHVDASAACLASGLRLCTAAEWLFACAGPGGLAYPYGNSFDGNACNGAAFDPDCLAPDDDLLRPTGSGYGCPVPGATPCASPTGILDASGNLAEWTSTAAGASFYLARGGGYADQSPALTCQYTAALGATVRAQDLGFRCCSSVPPGPVSLTFWDGFETGDMTIWSASAPPGP